MLEEKMTRADSQAQQLLSSCHDLNKGGGVGKGLRGMYLKTQSQLGHSGKGR